MAVQLHGGFGHGGLHTLAISHETKEAATPAPETASPVAENVAPQTAQTKKVVATDSYHTSDGATQYSKKSVNDDDGDHVRFSSTGDPHLAISGKQDGEKIAARFDSQTSHVDLVDSNAIKGGFQIATEVTAKNAHGVAYNKDVAVVADFGEDVVSVDNTGKLTVVSDGKVIDSSGTSTTVSSSEIVRRNADGSFTVTVSADNDELITTTLKANGHGVDVHGETKNVDIGGDLVAHADKDDHHVPADDHDGPSATTVSSTGDPHLRITSSSAAGSIAAHFDSQTSHVDLASSDDVASGFRISAETTAINAHHVSFNKEVTVSTNFFQDIVSVSKDAINIVSGGKNLTVAKGQTITLSGGETVTENSTGVYTVVTKAEDGGSISTVLKQQKAGVDVFSTAKNADFGGYIVDRARGILA